LDQTVTGKQVNGREIQVLRLKKLEEIKTCQILSISNSEKKTWAGSLKQLKHHRR
jgi:hypothetical protein